MKIIHIVEPFAAGVATFVRHQVEFMPFDKHIIIHGDRTEYRSAEEVKKSFTSQNAHFIRWPYARREISVLYDFLAFVYLIVILRRLPKPDVVHLHSSKAGLTGRVACWLLGYKNVIYTPNGLSFMRADKGVLHRYVFLTLERIGALFPGKVVAASASEHRALTRYGIDAIRINNGTTPDALSLGMPRKLDRKTFRIVTSGRIEEQKGPRIFNQIASYFERNPDIEFIWVGDGPKSYELQSENIRVTGWLDRMDVLEIIGESDLYLSCARWEGLPFSVMEAMSLGKNLLLHQCVGNEDLVQEGKNGMLFASVSEAVQSIKLFSNQQFLNQMMGNRSREICFSEFNARETVLQYRIEYAKRIQEGADDILTRDPVALGERIYTAGITHVSQSAA